MRMEKAIYIKLKDDQRILILALVLERIAVINCNDDKEKFQVELDELVKIAVKLNQ